MFNKGTMQEFSVADLEYSRFLLAQKTSPSSEIWIDTNLTTKPQEVFFFKLKVIQRGIEKFNKIENPNPTEVEVRLGCYQEQWLEARSVTAVSNPYFNAFKENRASLSVPRTASSYQDQFDLAKTIEFYSDIATCSAFKVTAFGDSSQAILASTSNSPLTFG